MDDNSTGQVIATVLTHFKEEKFSTIVLAGESGIGKTWVARRVSLFAVKQNLVDMTLWVSLSLRCSQRDLYENIARQLSLLHDSAEWENNGNEEEEDFFGKEETLEALEEKIRGRLSGACVLLVLDDEGSKMKEGDDQIMELQQFLQHSLAMPSLDGVSKDSKPKMKVLITSLNEGNWHQDIENTKKVINIKRLTLEMSVSLLKQKAGADIFSIPVVGSLVQNFVNKRKGATPLEVGLLGKLLSFHKDNLRGQCQARALEEVCLGDNFNFAHLISSGYDKVPDSVLLDFSWQGTHYFREHELVHYNELISYWIMEGYLGPVDCMQKSYEEGHRILMELMDCGLLKKVNVDYLNMKRVDLHFHYRDRCGIGGAAKLGLANVFMDKGSSFGKVSHMNGVIRTFGSGSKGCQTLLISGNSLSKEDSDDLPQINQELQILGLFSHRFVKLPPSLPELRKLNVLVLRACEFLESIDDIKHLNLLTVLEVSSSPSITSFPDDFFAQLNQLRSLNLSALQIKALPESFYDLSGLCWFILKDCSQLGQLKSLRKCKNLIVLDLSGAASLTIFPEKNLKTLPKLQMLNLSRSSIKSLPILHETRQLTHLVLSGCRNMNRVPSLKTLTNLQVLDISDSTIKEFHDKSLQSNHSLKVLDLSGTDITSDLLPSNFSNPYQLYMKGCSKIKQITCAESPKNLEILDLLGACSLGNIAEKFFEHLENLRVLNLTKAKLKVLPSLLALHNLRELLLSSCSCLVNLPALTSMKKLEVLDLSECEALTELEDESFDHLSCLRWLSFSETQIKRIPELKLLSNLEELNLHGVNSFVNAGFLEDMHNLLTLDLSETSLEQLPSLSNMKNLKLLRLSGCGLLRSLPSLEELENLEILDLSQTKVRSLPSLEKLTNLRELLLEGCSDLEHFANMSMAGLSVDMKNLPFGISKLENLVHLSLPRMKLQEKTPNQLQWSISSLSDDSNSSLISLSGQEFFELLASDLSLRSNVFSKHFYFSVRPLKQKIGSGGFCIIKDEFVFRDIYFLSRHFGDLKKERSVEIHDFDSFPRGIEDVLTVSEYVFLFADSFVNSIVDLGANNIKNMKGCWLEGCQKLEYAIDTEVGTVLEILWISNARSFKSLCGGSQPCIGFQNLNCLYLDSCPKVSGVLFPSYLPQNLAVLNIRFCEKLETLFGHDLEAQILPNLHTLQLWELSELKCIGWCIMPSLRVFEVGQCLVLEHLLPSSHVPQQLQVLKIRNCLEMSSLFEGMITTENLKLQNLKEMQLLGLPKLSNIGIEMPSLETLEVEHCHMLVHVSFSHIIPNDLSVLKVRFCDNIEILFKGNIITSSNHAELSNIKRVQLWGLPKLKSIGIALPALQNSIIRECPNLDTSVP